MKQLQKGKSNYVFDFQSQTHSLANETNAQETNHKKSVPRNWQTNSAFPKWNRKEEKRARDIRFSMYNY